MVAITVIMAAVIGAFVYGYGGSMVQAKDVACTARHVGDTIYITYMGGPDQELVLTLDATVGGSITADFDTSVAVGDVATKEGVSGTNNHVIVIAGFADDTEQVILDTFC
jgi:FlaG/FlaF family flagellin (archaellin)